MYKQYVTNMIASSDADIEFQRVPMTGRLTLLKGDGGFLMLEIPQDFVDQVFNAIDEEGIEKPDHRAHISVMSGEELSKIENVKEVGQEISFNIGPLMSVDPEGWDEMEKVWFIQCDAPELKELRKKYGLTPLIKNDHEFHITVAVKPRSCTKWNLHQKRQQYNI